MIWIIIGLCVALVCIVAYSFGEWCAKQKYEPMVYHDALTGLYNRDYLEDHREDFDDCYVTIVDIDGLKHTNDSLGHEMGDQRIKYVAAVLSMCDGTSIRLGGDEFLLISDTYPENLIHDLKFASCGTMFKDGKISLADAMRDADKNMYNMKNTKMEVA